MVETLQINLDLLQTVSGVSTEITELPTATATAAKIIQTETSDDIGYTLSSFQDAMRCRERARWLESIHKELGHHERNDTWRIVDRIKNQQLLRLSLRWVFKIKTNGTYKSRLVALGFRQVAGPDYLDVYAIVDNPMSFRIFVAIAAALGWHLHHADFTAAFLDAELKQSIFCHLPEDLDGDVSADTQCCHLLKSLYGLEQGPREWYQLIRDVLISNAFASLHADHGIFIQKTSDGVSFLLVYVDEILLLSPSLSVIEHANALLTRHFGLTDGGQITRYLDVEVLCAHNGDYYLSQKEYIMKALRRFGYDKLKSAPTPLNENEVLTPRDTG